MLRGGNHAIHLLGSVHSTCKLSLWNYPVPTTVRGAGLQRRIKPGSPLQELTLVGDKRSEGQIQKEGRASTLKRSPHLDGAGAFSEAGELLLGLEDCVGLRLA